jgi:hypothetical protein
MRLWNRYVDHRGRTLFSTRFRRRARRMWRQEFGKTVMHRLGRTDLRVLLETLL